MTYLPDVVSVRGVGPTRLFVAFDDGVQKHVDVESLLRGPIFRPVRDPTYFRKAAFDPDSGTVTWPNGADIAPETLYSLPAIEPAHTFRSKSRRRKAR